MIYKLEIINFFHFSAIVCKHFATKNFQLTKGKTVSGAANTANRGF